MYKKILLFLFLIFSVFFTNISFASNEVVVHFYWWNWCPHCEKEKEFLETIKQNYENVIIKDYEIWSNTENAKNLQKISETLSLNVRWVPFTIIWKESISWFLNETMTGKQIEWLINNCIENTCDDFVTKILNWEKLQTIEQNIEEISEQGIVNEDFEEKQEIEQVSQNIQTNSHEKNNEDSKYEDNNSEWQIFSQEEDLEKNQNEIEEITLPFVWEINVKNYSLVVLTILFWVLDWFNPCAMWVLLFLISMLIWMQDRKKMWILWIAFIVTSAFVYFLFMSAWLNIILFLWFLLWIRVWVWIFAIWGWIYNIREYIKNKWWCSVVNPEKRNKIFTKIKQVINEKSFLLSLIWICVVAFWVNLIELLCSAWLPVVYTQILSMSELSTVSHYLYILLYIFFFMLDDLIIFSIWMITLKITGFWTKYTKYSHLVWGILMILIWILLIFKPEILMFG